MYSNILLESISLDYNAFLEPSPLSSFLSLIALVLILYRNLNSELAASEKPRSSRRVDNI